MWRCRVVTLRVGACIALDSLESMRAPVWRAAVVSEA